MKNYGDHISPVVMEEINSAATRVKEEVQSSQDELKKTLLKRIDWNNFIALAAIIVSVLSFGVTYLK